MAAGRAGAAAARREEREMAAQQKRLAKEKGRKRAALAEADRGARAMQCPMKNALWQETRIQEFFSYWSPTLNFVLSDNIDLKLDYHACLPACLWQCNPVHSQSQSACE